MNDGYPSWVTEWVEHNAQIKIVQSYEKGENGNEYFILSEDEVVECQSCKLITE